MSELSRVEDLLVTGVEQPVEPMSRMEAILRGDDIKPQSRIEELLKQYDPGGGGAIELDDLSVTANGTYTPQENHAYKSVDVAVPAPPAPVLDDVTLTQNGVYTSEHDGYDEVTVAVPAPVLDTLSVTENGTYTSEHDGYSTVTVNVSGGGDYHINALNVSARKYENDTTLIVKVESQGNTLYSATHTCSIYGELSRVTSTFIFDNKEFTISYVGTHVDTYDTPFLTIDITNSDVRILNGHLQYKAEGPNSSYALPLTTYETLILTDSDEVELLVDRTTTLFDQGGTTTWDAVISYTATQMCYAEVTYYGDGYTNMYYTINGISYNQVLSSPGRVAGVLLNVGDIIAKRVDSGGGSPYFKMTIYPAIILGPAGHASLERLIPKLTANDSYSGGEAICDSAATNTSVNFRDRNFPLTAWHAFDDNDDTSWCCNNTGTNGWIGYHWNDPVYLKYIAMRLPQDMLTDRSSSSVYVKVHTSMDGTNWELQREFQYTKYYESYIVFANYITCKYFKITFNEKNAGWDNYLGVIGIRAYGMKYPYQSSDNILLCSGAQTVDKNNWTQYYMPIDTITEGSLYDEYLSYDSSTKQFTVLKDFYGLIQCTLTNEYTAENKPKMKLYSSVSDGAYADACWETGTAAGSTKTRSFGLLLTTGDTFGLYTPTTDGWGFGKIKVYKVDGVDES